MSFNMVFKTRLARRYFSQFSIMCAYLYEHKRDEYVWNIHDRNPGWDRVNPAPKYGQSNYTPVSTPGQLAVLQVADHARYMIKSVLGSSRRRDYFDLMRKGICYSPPFPKPWFPFCDFENFTVVESQSSSKFTASPIQQHLVNSNRADNPETFILFQDLFRFEEVNYMLVKPPETLLEVQRLRMQRIARCNHSWPADLVAYISRGISGGHSDISGGIIGGISGGRDSLVPVDLPSNVTVHPRCQSQALVLSRIAVAVFCCLLGMSRRLFFL